MCLKNRFFYIKHQIEQYKIDENIRLLAVSKGQPLTAIKELYTLGQRDFGENYVQEGLAKINDLSFLPEITWHFIGQVQSNKTKLIAENFDWVHTLDRNNIAIRLNAARLSHPSPLNVCIQIKASVQANRSGIEKDKGFDLARTIVQLPALKLKGLMIMPDRIDLSNNQQKRLLIKQYQDWRLYYNQFCQEFGLKINTLSMGMSSDMNLAIQAGSNLVRIGSALFGARPFKKKD